MYQTLTQSLTNPFNQTLILSVLEFIALNNYYINDIEEGAFMKKIYTPITQLLINSINPNQPKTKPPKITATKPPTIQHATTQHNGLHQQHQQQHEHPHEPAKPAPTTKTGKQIPSNQKRNHHNTKNDINERRQTNHSVLSRSSKQASNRKSGNPTNDVTKRHSTNNPTSIKKPNEH